MLDLLRSAIVGIDLLPVLGALSGVVQLWLVGRLLVGRDLPDLVSFGAGWGLAVLLMTVLGTTVGDGSLSALPVLLVLMAVLSLVLEIRCRSLPTGWMALLLVLPLALLISGRVGSEWDEFSHWLSAFRYLDAFQTLPGKGRPAIESCCAAYPYGWPLLGWMSSRWIGFSEAVPGLLNLFHLALCGDLLARVLARYGRPSFRQQAAGVLLVTALGTTFVPKLVFTAYADVSTSALILTMMWLVWHCLDHGGWRTWTALGLCGATLVSLKPSNLVLDVLVFGVGGILILMSSRTFVLRRLFALAAAFVPVACVWLLWRHFVGANLAGEELVIKPLREWNLSLWADILVGMLDVASNKGGYFGVMVLSVLWAFSMLFRPVQGAERLVLGVAFIFVGYNAFLYFTYLAVFLPGDAHRVASYWRYNTHLGLLTALLVALASDRFGHLVPAGVRATKLAMPVMVALVVLGPFLAVRHIRFDLDQAKTYLRQTLDQVAAQEGRAITILDPRGSGLSHVMASYQWNGKPKMASYTTAFDGADMAHYRNMLSLGQVVLVLSWSAEVKTALPSLTAGNYAVLAEKDGTVLATFPYPGDVEPKVFP